MTREERTKTDFPQEFCHLRTQECPQLVGVGARSKKLMGVKQIDVYAAGLYVDPKETRRKFRGQYEGLPPAALAQDQGFLDGVAGSHDVEKTVRIVLTSGLVNPGNFSKGIRESLTRPLKKVNDLGSLDKFEDVFKDAAFNKGLELSFSNTSKGALVMKIGDKQAGVVESPAFAQAFFGLYLGSEAVSPPLKKSVASGLSQLVSKAGPAQ